MILEKPCCYKLISGYLANTVQNCVCCRHTVSFPGYFWVNSIFTEGSRSSAAIDALYLHSIQQPRLTLAVRRVCFHFTSMIKCYWGLRGPDKPLPSFCLIQSWCSKVLAIAATGQCRSDVWRTQAVLEHAYSYWSAELRGKYSWSCCGCCGTAWPAVWYKSRVQ